MNPENAQEFIKRVRKHIEEMMGENGPPGIFDELFANMEYIDDLEGFMDTLGEAYNRLAERYAAAEQGGVGGRPLPDMQRVLARLQDFGEDFVGTF